MALLQQYLATCLVALTAGISTPVFGADVADFASPENRSFNFSAGAGFGKYTAGRAYLQTLPSTPVGSQTQPIQPPAHVAAANTPSWPRRHAAFFAGLALTGAGAALIATGGPEQGQGGCFNLPDVGPYCQPPGPIWLGHQRLAGVIVAGVGVPIAIIGLFKH